MVTEKRTNKWIESTLDDHRSLKRAARNEKVFIICFILCSRAKSSKFDHICFVYSVMLFNSLTISAQTSTSNSTIVTQVRQNGVRLGNRKLNASLHASSVPLELRELLDVVLTVARFVPFQTTDGMKDKAELSGFSNLNSSPRVLRPPVGLVTQLLWRARALDDRGPWILTFTMWWLMQHYFGIGSRSHHVRLRWSHLRLVTGVLDPITSRSCDALEYAGPSEYTTVKAFALLESTGNGSDPVRRVYPSSGWAEAEIHVASILASDAPENRPRIRPLYTGPDVPALMDREGPDFVSLYKAFSAHRSVDSCRPDSPFYVQPLHVSPQKDLLYSNIVLQLEQMFHPFADNH